MKPRPTMPTPTPFGVSSFEFKAGGEDSFGLLLSRSKRNRFDKLFGEAYVGYALVAGFAFDAEVAREFQFAQCAEKCAPIHFAGPDHDFVAPGARSRGPVGVLDMTLLQPGAERAQRRHRVALVVKDHVGRVEVHTDVGAVQFRQKSAEGFGALLAGFKSQVDAFRQFPESRVVVVVRQKTGVEGHQLQAELLGYDGVRPDVFPVFLPGGIRHETAGATNRFEGRIIFAGGPEHAGDHENVVPTKQLDALAPGGRLLTERVERDLDPADADGLELLDEVIRVSRLERPTADREALSQ